MYDTSHADEFVAKGGILECDLRLEQKIIGTSRSPTTPREKNSRKNSEKTPKLRKKLRIPILLIKTEHRGDRLIPIHKEWFGALIQSLDKWKCPRENSLG